MNQTIKKTILFFIPFLTKIYKNKIVFTITLSWLYALSSQVYIPLPFNWIPITLQTFVIFLTAMLFGRLAFFASLLWILQGVCGAPVFFGLKSGLLHLLGPTGGYLIGFVFSTLLISFLKDLYKKNIIFSNIKCFFRFFILLMGLFVLHTFGVAWLSFFVKLNLNMFLFFFVDLVKILFISLMLKIVSSRTGCGI